MDPLPDSTLRLECLKLAVAFNGTAAETVETAASLYAFTKAETPPPAEPQP
jgi:hypothetical protein